MGCVCMMDAPDYILYFYYKLRKPNTSFTFITKTRTKTEMTRASEIALAVLMVVSSFRDNSIVDRRTSYIV